MSGVTFLVPSWWPALVAIPAALWLGRVLARRQAQHTAAELGPRSETILGEPVHRRSRLVLAIAAAVMTALALLQPVAGVGEGEVVGPDVVVCLDVSRSMDARDVAPSRLAAAQQQITEFAKGSSGARGGLVVFAGDAHLAAPLTADLGSLATIAASFAAGAVGRGGSDPGAAIDAAVAALDRAHARSGGVVVLSDGEDFVGNGEAAAGRARAAGRVVHCIGLGSPNGSKIVVSGDGDSTWLRDADGRDVTTRLERANLEAIAGAGGGAVRDAEPAALVGLVDEFLAPAAVAAALRDDSRNPAHRFQWPLFAALLLWMLRTALPERRR